MENTSKESTVNITIGIVVVVAIVLMILQEVAKVNKDNSISRKGTISTIK